MSDYLKVVKTPSKFEVALRDISGKESGRTDDALMHKNRIAQKFEIAVAWNNTTTEETAEILTIFQPVYVNVEFNNPLTNRRETRRFYTGDKTMPVRSWCVGRKRYASVSFSIIER